jgi:Protein NO VEIN, C-terminal
MQSSIIINLQKELLSEATSAPKLFSDLGKVEQYIAESYKTRSFIELIQNADDANSSTFGIYSLDNMLVVANNGRPFTVHDIEALCRSGSSNKSRGGSTIGYRGIGFKSVVNLAKRIYIFSDDYKFYFDKNATRQLLPDLPDVPLIRVLHPYDEEQGSLKITNQLEQLADEQGYTTFFIFCDIESRIVEQELLDFDRNALLFLNNIRQVTCDVDTIRREIAVTKQYRNNQRIIEIREGDKSDTWELISSPKDPRDMIALKIKDDSIIPSTPEEAVVHSFTPTIEFAGAFIKINGDYSTDPSRKNIDFDEFSQRSFMNTLTLLVDTILDILEGNVVRKGFFAPFVNVPNLEGNKFKAKLYKGISEELNSRKLKNNDTRVAFSSLRLRPDWLNYEDYEKICAAGFCPVTKEMLTAYPELPACLEMVGVKRLYLNETLSAVNRADISVTGAAQITTKIISQHRYDMTKEKVAEINSLKLFPKGDKLVTAKEVESTEELKEDFVDYLANQVEISDLKQFIAKTEIKAGATFYKIVALPATAQADKQAELSSDLKTQTVKPAFKSTPNLQKWRSAEKNAMEYLQAMNGVLAVSDVSTANMGYDLEVMLENGKRVYIEVKSVNSFNEPFKITNNEYSSAHNYGDQYYLALVINNEPFYMRLIPEPIKNLSFQKQIERWSWLCDSYNQHIKSVEILLGEK